MLTKRRFTDYTVVQVRQFAEEIAIFRQQFTTQGPASPGVDLERGVELLIQFKAEVCLE